MNRPTTLRKWHSIRLNSACWYKVRRHSGRLQRKTWGAISQTSDIVFCLEHKIRLHVHELFIIILKKRHSWPYFCWSHNTFCTTLKAPKPEADYVWGSGNHPKRCKYLQGSRWPERLHFAFFCILLSSVAEIFKGSKIISMVIRQWSRNVCAPHSFIKHTHTA